MGQARTAFFVSDRTGITVEILGHSLLSQFDNVSFKKITLPFVDSLEKARQTVGQINRAAADGQKPLVFSTLVAPEISATVASANALFLDCFRIFITPLEVELNTKSSPAIGRSHSAGDVTNYHQRIEAVNFALKHDDGLGVAGLENADVILVGVSRCGKTPTCLYMALQFGVRAANYPLVHDDFFLMRLPVVLKTHQKKLYGLTIQARRLQQIRYERMPESAYSALPVCEAEIRDAKALMFQEGISYLDTTTKSVEELATTILHQANLTRHIY